MGRIRRSIALLNHQASLTNMCGICGVVGIEQPETIRALLQRMMGAMRHRGPDEEGSLVALPAGLGVQRLSVIDLPGGSQPIWNETRTLAVVLNGEIYNFRELRRTLEDCGHVFRTRSDTEVIVHAYEEWGEDSVHRLRGMFAFAIVEMPGGANRPPSRIFLARDRLGIKPLYYATTDSVFYFASEVRALIATDRIACSLSSEALSSYLLFGSIGEPTTLLQGVVSLPPGHRMSISVRQGDSLTPRPESYWDLAVTRAKTEMAEANGPVPAARRLRMQLQEAVRSHLVADAPLGIFLSSGMDSAAIAGLASRERNGIRTFTVAFPERDFSEAELARQTARRFGTEHRELLLSSEEMQARLGEAVAALDQPSMDGINTFFVSWGASELGLKVALSGLGGDELFGGYPTFDSSPQLKRLRKFSRFFPAGFRAWTAKSFITARGNGERADARRKFAAAWVNAKQFPHEYFFARMLFGPERAARLMPGLREAWQASAWLRWLASSARAAGELDTFTQVSWLELRSYLLNTLLRDTDGMSMRHSLEVRVPFLDHRLVEFVLGLPREMKRRPGIAKGILVEALEDLLPPETVRQEKRTFTLPWERWLRGPLRQRVTSGLSDWARTLEGVVDGTEARAIWQAFLSGRTSWSRPWSLYVLNEWVKRNLEGRGANSPADRCATAVST